MNSQIRSVYRCFVILLCIITLTACGASETQNPTVLLYDEWPNEGYPNDAAQINQVSLEKNLLTLEIDYQGGCEEHTFKLYAWSAFLQSLPPLAMLYLSHNAQNDECTEAITQQLTFDLTPLDEERNNASDHPLVLRIYGPIGGSFASDPVIPLIEWP